MHSWYQALAAIDVIRGFDLNAFACIKGGCTQLVFTEKALTRRASNMLATTILAIASSVVAAPALMERASVDRITPGISPNLCLQTTIYGGPLQL